LTEQQEEKPVAILSQDRYRKVFSCLFLILFGIICIEPLFPKDFALQHVLTVAAVCLLIFCINVSSSANSATHSFWRFSVSIWWGQDIFIPLSHTMSGRSGCSEEALTICSVSSGTITTGWYTSCTEFCWWYRFGKLRAVISKFSVSGRTL
jgi:hypothetical protein